MAKYKNDYNVMCPFYLGHKDRDIYCEGVQPTSSTINHLASKTDAEDYRYAVCQENWNKCLISTMLNSKY